ncbi:BtrH N-terminal domain-containing protein [Actinocrispum wychmicini]|uniref:Butirosin biosynthesis protein H-like n=1 Tax=Actinocrispum wychmicini TaxID=1213861 RepID=A0A4R2K3F9_9PSEU|nr:BtrH N-terminal domain-containing protein [Actinocrispum wychmicini]TCO60855.1 butirosin biosynthesis protein H-like [Actinocrispum wychmicini]
MTATGVIDDVVPWRHDLVGCLWTSAATILRWHGVPELETLGAAWGFRHIPTDLRREEYYYPTPPGVSLYEGLAPYHPVRSVWHEPADAAQGWEQVRAQVAAGVPIVVAADNFYLPFRPAYQDVHTNHLVIVYGYDDNAGTVRVLDAVPPRFDGDIRLDELAAARDSQNPILHNRDMFFTNQPIGNRWLEIHVDTDAFPPFDRDTVFDTIRRNLHGFRSAGDGYVGLTGQRAYLADVAERFEDEADIRDELFLVAGAVLANTALHADWLVLAASAADEPALAVLGRSVQRIAHHWTAVRIMSALTSTGEMSADRLRRRFSALCDDQARVLAELSDVVSGKF